MIQALRTPDERFVCLPGYEVEHAGHFTQEWGEDIARKALEAFK
jgi:hypothetical protein